MANSKEGRAAARPPRRSRRIRPSGAPKNARSGDVFYFDQEAWDYLMEEAARKLPRNQGFAANGRAREARAKQLEAQRAKARAASERIGAEQRRRHWAKRHPEGDSLKVKVLQAMAPGEYYGTSDLANLVGSVRYTLTLHTAELEQRGFIRRVRNPEYRRTGDGQPRDLWILTPAGEIAKRDGWSARWGERDAKGIFIKT